METTDQPVHPFGSPNLLPIREAYEWKPSTPNVAKQKANPCFQFVKRMNGNIRSRSIDWNVLINRLASNS